MREDRQLLMLTHLSQLLDFVTGIGGFVAPLILWILKKEKVLGMDFHGKAILNFRISMFLYVLICIPFVIFFGLGFIGLIVLGIIYLIYPIINAVKANNGEMIHYPLSIQFIK
jgi:uncharacterized Tic20 family protein